MTPASAPKVLDGSVLEGGGQLLRNSMTLAALTGKPISINNIRGRRNPPGLRNQHAAGLRLVADIASGVLEGARNGSSEIDFIPRDIQLGDYLADPGTAGSTTLLLQVSLPCLIFAPMSGIGPNGSKPSTLTLRGGTNASHAPPIDYTQHVFLPFIGRHFGLSPDINVRKRGYYPKGGGEVVVTVPAVTGPLPAVTLTTRGAVRQVRGRAYVAGVLPILVANKMRDAATAALLKHPGISPEMIEIECVKENEADAVGTGSGIVLWCETTEGCVLGGSALGAKSVNAKKVGESAAAELVRNLEHGGCVDEYLQDQIVIFMALAEGVSTVSAGPLTMHTRTAIWVAEQLTEAKFEVNESDPAKTTIKCIGIGYRSPTSGQMS
ncbi:RNA 3'-terminal phosphate cyclase [Punctularia strigosozonata HHB-11173 SS5]|uniref:RNA 3'-terminal phosphate cyclase n=1 Tax=Punctularia strigosozonata (strain HHB-11173) TaxID=741275 RepID=UPI000441799E|nr:RNA 3'-terminal phosphate cyclase [Punctularia strigosozonata HHB-11173 SS5]EIN07647.1 RNA 3'-terminal phosphate cyclase [Punctularia strigosozonata HHB-11173 SS5]